MQLYLDPLQGLTDWIFRESFAQHIGAFDKTFTPFVRVQCGEFYGLGLCNYSEKRCPLITIFSIVA